MAAAAATAAGTLMPETETFTTNASQLAEQLAALAARIGNPAPALERARRLLAQQEAQVWSTEGATIGAHWPPPADPDRKVDARLLVATGALRASLADPAAGEAGFDTLRFGTSVSYGIFHQYGTRRMPRRQFLGLSPATARQITEAISRGLEEAR